MLTLGCLPGRVLRRYRPGPRHSRLSVSAPLVSRDRSPPFNASRQAVHSPAMPVPMMMGRVDMGEYTEFGQLLIEDFRLQI